MNILNETEEVLQDPDGLVRKLREMDRSGHVDRSEMHAAYGQIREGRIKMASLEKECYLTEEQMDQAFAAGG